MFKAVKRTEGVSTTDIVRNQRRDHQHHGHGRRPHDHQVGRMLTCGMEHFVDDEEMRGNSAILILPANSLLSSVTFVSIQASEPAMFQQMTPSPPRMQFVVPTSFPPATASGVELLMT
jgi:hypothetical protein